MTNNIVDAIFIFKSPADLPNCTVILHGASCVGKSTILQKLKRHYAGCEFIDMDIFPYWKTEAEPGILNDAVTLLKDADIEEDASKALVHSIEHSHRVQKGNSRHWVMVELLRASLSFDTVMTTCGNLPPPYIDYGFYELLAKCSDKPVLHVLLAPENDLLAERVRARGQASQIEQYISSNNWWLEHRASYNLVLRGSESTADIMNLIRTSLGH